MMQLRQAQSDLAAFQATQAAQADEGKAAKEQLALLIKHSSDDKAESTKAVEALKAKLSQSEGAVAKLEDSLAQWKAAAEKMNQASRSAEVKLSKALASAAAFERRAEDLKIKNAELFRIGSEILDRYQKFSLGQQFLAREPFIGRARADLESQIQDFSDQMEAEKVAP